MKGGANQVKGGARQAQAGARELTEGAYDEAQRGFSRVASLPGEAVAAGRDVWLAGLGALSAAGEEGEKLFSDLVERGQKLEKQGRDQVNETAEDLNERQKKAMKTAGDTAAGTFSQVEKAFTGAFKSVFERFDVPTRGEVRGLASKVERLASKVDGLAVTLEKQSNGAAKATATVKTTERTTYHVAPHEEGWAVTKEGAERATSVHGTKKEAVEGGREFAKTHRPSELVVHKQDRSVQETFSYEEEDAE